MLRLSSQSKSTRSLLTAVVSDTGICTSPKLIAPFQIALLAMLVSSPKAMGCHRSRQTLHR